MRPTERHTVFYGSECVVSLNACAPSLYLEEMEGGSEKECRELTEEGASAVSEMDP